MRAPNFHRAIPADRLHAAQHCRSNGWRPGTLVHSPAWQWPRRIDRMTEQDVSLTPLLEGGYVGHTVIARTFPRDVAEVSP